MKSEFTGRHMAATMIIGFGIVIAVNFTMAYHATSGFGGVVVKNSYVASQKFNGWLEEAQRQEALGWSARVERMADGRLRIETEAVPTVAKLSAIARHTLGKAEPVELDFIRAEAGHYVSTQPVPPGRFTVRLTIESGTDRWAQESPLF